MNIPESTNDSTTPMTLAGPVIVPAHLLALRPAKIRDHHLDRKAIVYVRQSSPQQVLEHKESTARQYALADVAVALGWPRDRVEVVDADQGRTGQTVEGRRGFQYILAELSLDHVGILLGQDASRLARSDPDWVPLVRSCGLFRALLGDYDGLYDPTDFNDRLLLGLKGIMSEAELHFLRVRMHEGRLNKARRGELFNHPPIGYVREPGRGLALDPDEQAQEVVRTVFDQFDRQGSLHGLLRWLVHHGIRLPVRPHFGPNRGKLEWHRPNRETLQNMVHHPVYAGYYRHGHRALDPRRKVPGRPGTGRTIHKPEDCLVLLEDRCPAYITPDRFRANQERLEANRARSEAAGAVRQGLSLLGGILRCGRDQPRGLSECDREQIRALSQDLPALWHAPVTTSADRQRIIRLLIDEVVVTVRGESEWVDVTIHWAGGFRTTHEVVRPVQRYQQLADYERLLNRIDALSKAGQSLADVAEQLNREGFHPPKRSARLTSATLTRLLAKRSRTGPRPRVVAEPGVLGEHEWLLSDLARKLEMPQATLHRWVRVGWVHARKLPTRGGHWAIWADTDELDRMTRLRTCPRGWSDAPLISQLIQPKTRDSE